MALPLRPRIDVRPYAALPLEVRDTLDRRLLRWPFRKPQNPGAARPLGNGQWLPIESVIDEDRNTEHPLGRGGQGIVHLWACVDDNNRIIDRVIVKEVVPGRLTWLRPTTWRDGKVGGEPREVQMAVEIYEQLESDNPGDGKYVTKCLGYGNIRNPFRHNRDGTYEYDHTGLPTNYKIGSYKMYLEYCPFGDMWDQIERQAIDEDVPIRRTRTPGGRLRTQRDRSPGGTLHRRTTVKGDVPFHEGFILMLFEALAKCAVAMERANIVHGDMSTSNVFLGDHDPDHFKIWPVPKLADFGGSRKIDYLTKIRAIGMYEPIQTKFAPPELAKESFLVWEVPNMQVSHKTNVWQIGMIIICAMRLEGYLPETGWRHGDTSCPYDDQLRFDDSDQCEINDLTRYQVSTANYSIGLRRLTRECLKFDPKDRPSPARLLRKVQRLIRTGGRVKGFDTYKGDARGRIPWNKKEKLRGEFKDKWQIGGEVDLVDTFVPQV